MKKLALAVAAFGLAMLTACDDDSSSANNSSASNIVSCDMVVALSGNSTVSIESDTSHVCAEAEASSTAGKQLVAACITIEGLMTSTPGTGCPSGYTKTCTDPETGGIEHIYNKDAESIDCDSLMSDSSDEDDSLIKGESEDGLVTGEIYQIRSSSSSVNSSSSI